MHLLGIDHAGHTGGVRGPVMERKEAEADEFIRAAVTAAKGVQAIGGKRTLIVVASDHGLTDDGNHGGASDAETHGVLAFVHAAEGPAPWSNPDDSQYTPVVRAVWQVVPMVSVPC